MRKRFLALTGVTAAAILLSGCGGESKKAADKPPASQATTPAATATSPDPATTTTGGSPAGQGKIAVTETIDDPAMGDHVLIQAAVRGFPVPASMSAIQDREIVLVKVTATAGSKYYAGWQTSGLLILTADGSENSESTVTAITGAMTTAGYPPFPKGGSVSTGKTGSGWVAFVVDPKDSPTLTLRMERNAAKTSGGTTIPAKNFDVVLVK